MRKIFGLIWFVILVLLLVFFKNKAKEKNDKIIKYLLIYLIIFKITETTIKVSIGNLTSLPVDFSAIMYYILPISILFDKDKILKLAMFGSFLAGLGYLITFIFVDSLYLTFTTYDLIVSSINHGILFFVSSLLMYDNLNSNKDLLDIFKFTFIMFIYSFIMWHLIDFREANLFIYQIMFGKIFGFSNITNKYLFHIINISCVFILYFIINEIYIIINKLFYKKHKINLKNK